MIKYNQKLKRIYKSLHRLAPDQDQSREVSWLSGIKRLPPKMRKRLQSARFTRCHNCKKTTDREDLDEVGFCNYCQINADN